ncbi:unnamed protein product, partial [Laminaria digitata]
NRGPPPSSTVGSSAARKGGGSGLLNTPKAAATAAAVVSVDLQSARSKRSGGTGTRPPLSALGPNPKRREHDQRRPITAGVTARSDGRTGLQDTLSDNCDAPPRWHSQGRASQGRVGQGRASQGSAQGASDAWRTPVSAAASRNSGAKAAIGG